MKRGCIDNRIRTVGPDPVGLLRFLRVLRRAIDEETLARMNRERFGASERDRERLQCLCTVAGMVQDTIISGLDPQPAPLQAAGWGALARPGRSTSP